MSLLVIAANEVTSARKKGHKQEKRGHKRCTDHTPPPPPTLLKITVALESIQPVSESVSKNSKKERSQKDSQRTEQRVDK